MSDETLYFSALARLSSITSGSSDFEKICHILIKSMYPEYDFKVPEGGRGTQDGGYDGYDPIKRAKLACSLDQNYKAKIRSEIEKSRKNNDLELFYLSNQSIPNKEQIELDFANNGIKLIIFGIDGLSREIEYHFRNQNDVELYDLLQLASLKNGECYNRGDVKKVDLAYNGNLYKKRVIINDSLGYGINNIYTETKISENPLLDIMLSYCLRNRIESTRNIILCGIGYLGKTLLMKITFNALINEFSAKDSYSKYQYIPYIQFYQLKYYYQDLIRENIKNNIDPLFIFLDGLDELNESKRILLNSEIQNILTNNNRVRFIISGRNASFINMEIFHFSCQLYLEKYQDPDDIELIQLMEEYKGTPIADLLPIPTYRNFVVERRISKNSQLEEFYKILVKDNLIKDKERNDYSREISQRMTSTINIDEVVTKISEFCYGLFIAKKIVFAETELQEYLADESNFIFVINSSIIDYLNEYSISFISNFYYEYFVSNSLLIKNKNIIIRNFFLRGKLQIPLIDIFVLFLNCAKTKSRCLYNFIIKNALKDNIVYILLCEFDSLTDEDRYKYYISIFKSFKKENRTIYYGRFRQPYGPLKNIDNMARRMQQLLPSSYRNDGVNFLKDDITNYLKYPSKKEITSFGNAVILLIPFINDLWSTGEQIILNELSLPLIKFFMYNSLSEELRNLLSERFIFDWYKMYDWTFGWQQKEWKTFLENVYGSTLSLQSEIINNYEYRIKFDIFVNYYDNDYIKPLLMPILRYSFKNNYFNGHGMASVVPEMITDDYETPMIQSDEHAYILSDLLEEIELSLSEILNLLIFTIEEDLYESIKDAFNSPIKILEEKLYKNIISIEKKDYESFARYYFGTDEFGFDNRLFQGKQTTQIEKLRECLVDLVITENIKKWGIGDFLKNLINFNTTDRSLECLYLIKEKMPKGIYADVIYCIFNDSRHIINNSDFIVSEYQDIFKKEIAKKAERARRLELVKKEIEAVKNNDIRLMLNQVEMIDELKNINNFLLESTIPEEGKTHLHKIHSLKHQNIIQRISYDDAFSVLPVFSECAIKIMEGFYRSDIFDIDAIIKNLQGYSFISGNFYIYFYWVFINKTNDLDEIEIKKRIDSCPILKRKILDSMNKDLPLKFLNKTVEFFERDNYQWLTPFFYYYDNLLKKVRPRWMQVDHILNLIVVPDPRRSGLIISTDINLGWFEDKFPDVSLAQIIEFGLKIIENVKNVFSRIQIIKYFINYYKSNEKNILTEKILIFIIDSTQKLFNTTFADHISSEFQYIGIFWSECSENYIDRLFLKFTTNIITSAIRKGEKDIDFQYRKYVLLYCAKVATDKQKIRIIHEIEEDIAGKTLSSEENEEINGFLASLGKEESVKFIINSYLDGKAIQSRHSLNRYPLGYIHQNGEMLKYFINLFFYSTDKSTERRSMLLHISQNGIKQHLTRESFKIFEKRMTKAIKKIKKQSSWKSEYYEEYLLQMEQFIFS
jgi:hypothetical protein